jgi:hypothetical protein
MARSLFVMPKTSHRTSSPVSSEKTSWFQSAPAPVLPSSKPPAVPSKPAALPAAERTVKTTEIGGGGKKEVSTPDGISAETVLVNALKNFKVRLCPGSLVQSFAYVKARTILIASCCPTRCCDCPLSRTRISTILLSCEMEPSDMAPYTIVLRDGAESPRWSRVTRLHLALLFRSSTDFAHLRFNLAHSRSKTPLQISSVRLQVLSSLLTHQRGVDTRENVQQKLNNCKWFSCWVLIAGF